MTQPAYRSDFSAVVTTASGVTRIEVAGVIDERANLEPVAGAAGTRIEIDLGGVRRINSYGVRQWLSAMRRLQRPDVKMTFVRCPAVIVDQVTMVHGVLGGAEVLSVLAPRLCEACDEHLDQLVELTTMRAGGGKLPDIDCPGCGKPMELDDVDYKYELLINLPPRS
jgi:anti-anti-sigma regulatory factor